MRMLINLVDTLVKRKILSFLLIGIDMQSCVCLRLDLFSTSLVSGWDGTRPFVSRTYKSLCIWIVPNEGGDGDRDLRIIRRHVLLLWSGS